MPVAEKRSKTRRAVDRDAKALAEKALAVARVNAQNHEEHQAECVETRLEIRGKLDNLTKMQEEQTVTLRQHSDTLVELGEVLPWLKQNYKDKKARDDMWRAIGGFFAGMVRKNLETLIGQVIFIALGAILIWKGVPWTEAIKVVLSH